MLRSLLMLLSALLLAVLACALPIGQQRPESSPLDAATDPLATAPPFAGTSAPVHTESLALERFAPFRYTDQGLELPTEVITDFTSVNKAELPETLSEAQQQALLESGLVVVPIPYDNFGAAYQYVSEQKQPLFITTDFILHSFQVVVDVAWQRAERNKLPADLGVLSEAMVAASLAQLEATDDARVAEAASRNAAFFSVASRLLNPEFTVPPEVSTLVHEELTLIAQGGTFISPLFERQMTYDYPKAEQAGDGQDAGRERYRQAMHWYARPFLLEQNNEPVAKRRTALQMLLMAHAVQSSENLSRWERIYQPTLYFQGHNAAWSLLEIIAVAEAVYGSSQGRTRLNDQQKLDDFIATLYTVSHPTHFNQPPVSSFSFMPSPSYPGDVIVRELIFNQVGIYTGAQQPQPRTAVQTSVGTIRALPRVLDIPAALHSELALSYVQASGDASYDGYVTQLERLRGNYGSLDQAAWTQTRAGSWLYSTQPLLAPAQEGLPPFMQSTEWQNKQLNSWYGAWVELHDDTMLAPRPIEALELPVDTAFAYVEPQPVLYSRLAATARQIIEGLDARDLLDEEAGQKLLYMERLLQGLVTISRKELSRTPLTEDEALLLTQLVQRLANLTTFAPAVDGGASQTDLVLPRIVDIYQDATSGKLLQAANGEIWPIYVLVPREDRPVVALGAVYSTYELLGEQLRAEAWQNMDERPQPAPWAAPYVVP